MLTPASSSVGKNKTLLTKYSQAHKNPCQSLKACLVQTYSPPSSGNRADNVDTTSADGNRNASDASSHNVNDPGPVCTTGASQRTPMIAEMLNRIRCQSLSSRGSAGLASIMWGAPGAAWHLSRSSYTMGKGCYGNHSKTVDVRGLAQAPRSGWH